MRWDSLFTDLEGQLEFELSSEDRERRIEDERIRVARLTVRERAAALRGQTIRLRFGEEPPLAGRVAGLGKDWLLVEAVPDDAPRVQGRSDVQGRSAARGRADSRGRAGAQGHAEPRGSNRPHDFARTLLVPLRSLRWIETAPDHAVETVPGSGEPASAVPRIAERISLPFLLRDLARRRRPVVVVTDEKSHGTIDRVGADHCDLALHPEGTPRRRTAVTAVRIVAFHTVRYIELS
ncbi:hypothetical protein [Mycetocola reblochoni]|uniref:Uncharacterized protein n=2 Tax=Mycetocola reblochoni TaxID=331618 RepID=A0A1R4K1U8_9MICO|nr:hypothetical protein [Mycetocola reblochoni]RLP70441.1 hypothetical protein D9V30_02735 [Mycetocola reblochoni]SJN38144.1 hypothetical protein FM119_10840 [Mycetocola reblochoni REB411]